MIGAKEDRFMKKIIIAMAAIAAAFTVASCNKELVNPNENPTVGKSVITASIENDATKTALTPDEEGYKVVWKEGDKIYVGDINEEMWSAEYTLDSSSADSSKGTFGWQDGDFFCPENDIYTKPTFEKGEEYEAIYPFSFFLDILHQLIQEHLSIHLLILVYIHEELDIQT